jgi:hypothetical protein
MGRYLSEAEYNTIDLVDKEISFQISSIRKGTYFLNIFYDPVNIDDLRLSHDPIRFECNIEIQRGNKRIIRKVSLVIKDAELGTWVELYNIPEDFSWSMIKNHNIFIKDISFDSNFTKYYKKIWFAVEQRVFD